MTQATETALIAQLIRENRNAPADTLIRAVFNAGATNVKDVAEPQAERFSTARAALDYWYSVDEMQLGFIVESRPAWLLLIHQHSLHRPHVDDVCDYTTNLEDIDGIAPALKEESYALIYRD
jgi:hypothetical protein